MKLNSLTCLHSNKSDPTPVLFRPLIPLVCFFIFGIIIGDWCPGYKFFAGAIITAVFLAALHIIKTNKKSLITPLILFLGLGYLSIQPWSAPDYAANHIIHYYDTHSWEIIGLIANHPVKRNNRTILYLDLQTLAHKKQILPVKGKIRVTVLNNNLCLDKGATIRFQAKIKSIRNFNNPGGFDYERYMRYQKVSGSSYVYGTKILILKKQPHSNISSWINHLQQGVVTLISRSAAENEKYHEARAILKALLIGDKSSIEKPLKNAFNRAGASHLLAISGLHIGIVATVSFIIFSRLLSRINFFLRQAWVAKGAAILSFFPVVFYGLLAGMAPSTQRAVIMTTMFLLSFMIERETEPVNTLAIAAMLILFLDPPALFSISFQLSFAAVFAIIYGLSKISPINFPQKSKSFVIINKIYLFFMVSLFAISGTAPLVMFYFNQISLTGLISNMILIPLIGFLAVPIGLLAIIILPITFWGAKLLIICALFILEKSISLVYFAAGFPFSAIKTFTPTSFEIFLFFLLIWAFFNLKTSRWARYAAIAAICAVLADSGYWVHKRFFHQELKVTAINVGQGSAALLELPKGPCVLIDGGGFNDNLIFDVGERIIAPLLLQKRIKTLDLIILSHPNSDHLNGLLYILQNFSVKEVWTNNQPCDTMGYRNFLKIIEQRKIPFPEFSKIPRKHSFNKVILKILSPETHFRKNYQRETQSDLNNNSLVVKVIFNSTSFLFPGDIMRQTEKKLVAKQSPKELQSMVLFAPHHGSKSSSTPEFIKKVDPDIVVISAGWKNRFKFPHPKIIKRYQKNGCQLFRTDICGAITIFSDGSNIRIKPFLGTEKGCM